MDNGLGHNQVTGIAKDGRGFTWIATTGGLSRFDGNHVFSYNNKNTSPFFSDNEIDNLIYRCEKLFLFSQKEGCIQLNLADGSTRKISSRGIKDFAFMHDSLYVFYSDGNLEGSCRGRIFARRHFMNLKHAKISSHNGFLIINTNGNEMSVIDKITLKHKGNYTNIFEPGFGFFKTTEKGEHYYFNRKQLYVLKDEFSAEELIPYRGGGEINYFVENEKGETRISYLGEGVYIEYRNEVLLVPSSEISNASVDHILDITDNCILIGTSLGAYVVIIQPVISEPLNEEWYNNNLTFRHRRKIYDSGDGNLYLSGFPGMIVYNKKSKEFSELDWGIPVNTYGGTVFKNKIYISSEGREAFEFNPRTGERKTLLEEGVCPITQYEILPIWDSIILIGAEDKLLIFDPQENKVEKLSTQTQFIYELIYVEELNRLFYATEKGLFWSIPGKNKSPLTGTLKATGITELCRTAYWHKKTRHVWVASKNGIWLFNPANNKITAHLTSPEYLTDNRVTAILEDRRGKIWASSFNGITCIDTEKRAVFKLNQKAGLSNSEYNYKSALALSDGRLMFGGMESYDIINPEIIEKLNKENTLVISATGIEKNGKLKLVLTENDTENLSFHTGEEALTIYLSEKTYDVYDHTFQYRVNKGPWNRIPKHSPVHISNMNPGTYEVEFSLLNPISEQVASKTITIQAYVAFYQTKLFYLVIMIIILLLFLLILYIRYRNNLERIRIKDRIAMDLHDEVGTVLTRVSLLTSQPLEKEIQQQIKESTNEAFQGLRAFMKSLDNRRYTFADLEDEAKEFIESQFKYSNKETFLRFVQDKNYNIHAELFRDIKLCLYEVSTNIVKHSKSDNVQFLIEAKKNLLQIYVSEPCIDEGNAFKVSGGRGLTNLSKRTKRHKGSFAVHTKNDELTIHLIFKI